MVHQIDGQDPPTPTPSFGTCLSLLKSTTRAINNACHQPYKSFCTDKQIVDCKLSSVLHISLPLLSNPRKKRSPNTITNSQSKTISFSLNLTHDHLIIFESDHQSFDGETSAGYNRDFHEHHRCLWGNRLPEARGSSPPQSLLLDMTLVSLLICSFGDEFDCFSFIVNDVIIK